MRASFSIGRHSNNGSAAIAVGLLLALSGTVQAAEPASVTLDGKVYGAQADDAGPIGGGAGYKRIVTRGDHTAKTLDELLEALGKAKRGEVVFIPGETEIDCTARVYIEELVLEIPEGVTLAGNRGENGSLGASITSDALKTPVLIRVNGPDARITGLRIRGPNPKRYTDHHRRAFAEGRGHEYYYKLPVSDGIRTTHDRLEVDNCEISAWAHAAIFLQDGDNHRIHHSFIHHCQYNGLGYGVCHDTATSLIERNIFDAMRHAIAGTGRPGCGYEARHNLVGGTSLSHCFDMHGGRDRGDGTDIAGTKIVIEHNTFRAPEPAVVIRGVPQEFCRVSGNWIIAHDTPDKTIVGGDRLEAKDNAYGSQPAVVK